MTDCQPTEGDRVRLVLEGTATGTRAGGAYFIVGDNGDSTPIWPGAPVVSVEKVEPTP